MFINLVVLPLATQLSGVSDGRLCQGPQTSAGASGGRPVRPTTAVWTTLAYRQHHPSPRYTVISNVTQVCKLRRLTNLTQEQLK